MDLDDVLNLIISQMRHWDGERIARLYNNEIAFDWERLVYDGDLLFHMEYED